jgi:outer membrane protein assembly factor BamB
VVLPARWFLVARDAFNGVELWRKPVSPWEWHLRGFRSGPPELSRALVADGDRVYAILGYGKPVVALDAASGKRLRTYERTGGAVEIVLHEGTLYVIVGERAPAEERPDTPPWARGVTPRAYQKRVLAIDAASGRTLWEKAGPDVAETMPLCLAVARDRVFLQNPEAVLCLASSSGDVLWSVPRPISTSRLGWSTPTLVVYEDVVLSADRVATERAEDGSTAVVWSPSSAGGNAPQGELIAFSADTGDRLWSAPCQEGYNSPVDVLVADGLVWSGQLVTAKQPGITVGRDPRTGEIRRERPPDSEFFTVGMGHHRCYRNHVPLPGAGPGRGGVRGREDRGCRGRSLGPGRVPVRGVAVQWAAVCAASLLRLLHRGQVPRLPGSRAGPRRGTGRAGRGRHVRATGQGAGLLHASRPDTALCR